MFIYISFSYGQETSPFHVIDIGAVDLNSEQIYGLIVQNDNNYPLIIKEISPSCECINIISFTEKIPPLVCGNILIKLVPNKPGSFSYEIILKTNDNVNPILKYRLDIDVEENRQTGIFSFNPDLTKQNHKEKHKEFLISAESVLQKMSTREKILLVDVRSEQNFNEFRIPGSVNIQLFSIPTKNFLKLQPFVLINEGYNYSILEEYCARLKPLGFKVRIMDGGLNYWRCIHSPIEGDYFAQKEIEKVNPKDFFLEKDYPNWLIIDASLNRNQEANILIPQSVHIPFSDKFKTEVGKKLKNYDKDSLPFLLIFNTDGTGYEEIEQNIESLKNANVFFLKTGLVGYKNVLEQLTQSDEKKYIKIKNKGCKSCP